ncbi:MAG: 4-hydroxy-tetrahydrodipicolinate reductase [Verrucomicrobiota bacterium]|nr:4-hydroxy-tetrahydrodipicolinate reductase [Verrucomicrobiota bacterium]
MPNKISLGIIGASGRLGRSIAALALQDPLLRIGGVFTRPSSHWLHHDLGEILGISPTGITLSADLYTPLDLYIDASLPKALPDNLQAAIRTKRPLVVGTTGLSPEDRVLLEETAQHIPLFYAANFSLGMALLHKLTRETARLFHPQADIDLIETHHAQKKDAPSGSALALAETIQDSHPTGKALHLHSIRSGSLIGEHELRFNSDEEQLILSHRVHTRASFARGALAAARFLIDQPPGLYTMEHLLS